MPFKKVLENDEERLLINEMQLLLAEKRTYHSLLRTGLTIFSVPLTVIIFLIATADYHNVFDRPWLAVVLTLSLGLVSAAGLFVFIRAEEKIRKIEKLVSQIKGENKRIAEIVV